MKRDAMPVVVAGFIAAILVSIVSLITIGNAVLTPPEAVIIPIGPFFTDREITFDGSKSKDPDGTMIISYKWDFGNGEKDSGEIVKHSFEWPSMYTITLEVMDRQRQSALTQKEIDVKDFENEPEIGTKQIKFDAQNVGIHKLSFDSNDTILIQQSSENPVGIINVEGKFEVNEKIFFSAKNSFDPDGDIMNFKWNMGDGTINSEKELHHIYSKEGKYNVILEVTDNSGLKNEKLIELEIKKLNPFNVIFSVEFLVFLVTVSGAITGFLQYHILKKRKKNSEKIIFLSQLYHELLADEEALKSKKIPKTDREFPILFESFYDIIEPEIITNFMFYQNKLKIIEKSQKPEDFDEISRINMQLKKLIDSYRF